MHEREMRHDESGSTTCGGWNAAAWRRPPFHASAVKLALPAHHLLRVTISWRRAILSTRRACRLVRIASARHPAPSVNRLRRFKHSKTSVSASSSARRASTRGRSVPASVARRNA